MTLSPPRPVKPMAAILHSSEETLEEALRLLAERWGAADHIGAGRPFDSTRYYEPEMGPGLIRRIVSFRGLIPSEALIERKLEAMEVEEALRGPAGGRRVNIDPGYIDLHKVVLASSKEGPAKIHMGRGIHADMVARIVKGKLEPCAWTFEDFRRGAYDEDLSAIRRLYKAELGGA